MAEILTRTGLRSLVDTDLPSGTAAITAADHRNVEDSLIDSLATIFEAQVRVINMTTTAPPGGASDRDAYVIASGATAAWAGLDNQIAIWDDDKTGGGGWQYSGAPVDGMSVWNLDDDKEYRWNGTAWVERTVSAAAPTESIIVAVSDETTALTTGTAKITFRMPYAFTLSGIRASVATAPTGANLIVDVNEGGTTILSTKLSIDAGEKTSTTAATPPVISDSSLADDAEMTIDIDQIGSTVAGAGLKVTLIGTRT